MKRTKIVVTIGPACRDKKVLQRLIQSGIHPVRKGFSNRVNVFRINFSHGTHQEHQETILILRKLSQELKTPIGILADLSGPKIRVGKITDEPIKLTKGSVLVLSSKPGRKGKVGISYPDLPKHLRKGDKLLFDDGKIGSIVQKITKTDIQCKILNPGYLYSHKGITVLSENLTIPALTEKDKKDLQFAIQKDVDFVALSFVKSPWDILELKKILRKRKSQAQIIAKIEKPQALKDFDSILAVSDGIMVARGDLGVEIPIQEVPMAQKEIIRKCNRAGKPVITATQMLESMINNPRPTRAEATDIANAILDGTDAVMLSGETAIGKYPVECVKIMAEIAIHADNALCRQNKQDYRLRFARVQKFELHRKMTMVEENTSVTEAISESVAHLAELLNVGTIVTATSSGSTARMISRYRPKAGIFAITPKSKTLNQLQLSWGVEAVLSDRIKDTDQLFHQSTSLARKYGFAKKGDHILVTAGLPMGQPGRTNLIRVCKV